MKKYDTRFKRDLKKQKKYLYLRHQQYIKDVQAGKYPKDNKTPCRVSLHTYRDRFELNWERQRGIYHITMDSLPNLLDPATLIENNNCDAPLPKL